MSDMAFDAIVLAGGSARRLGGVDKPGLVVGDRSMLDTVLLACAGAQRTVVVGPERPVMRPVVWTREDPVSGGPAAALAAGLSHVTTDHVVLLAADLPFVDRATVDLLLSQSGEDGALFVDDQGRDQLLCSAWRTAALRAAVAGVAVENARLRPILAELRVHRLSLPANGDTAPWTDCDTPADLARARASA